MPPGTIFGLAKVFDAKKNNLICRKSGFLPFMGKLVLLPYFAISTVVRLFSVMRYFTPTLGLFDTLHHLNQGGNSKALRDVISSSLKTKERSLNL